MDFIGNSDGLMSNLYYYLWMKDDCLKDTAFPVTIPDTIIFKTGLPQTWYFTSQDTGLILMHKKEHNQIKFIKESFLKRTGQSQIVAQFIFEEQDQDDKSQTYQTYEMSLSRKAKLKTCDKKKKISILYLDAKLFLSFLDDPNYHKVGILQRFIQPIGDSETLIQAIWSPAVCILEKCVNLKAINDTQFDPQERCATFGSAQVHSKSLPLQGRKICSEIRQLVQNIINRIRGITFEKEIVTRGVFYFKADDKNKLYFVYCSGIRTKEENVAQTMENKLNFKLRHNNTPLSLGQNFLLAKEVKRSTTVNTLTPANMINNIICFDCQQRCQKSDLCEVTFLQLIKYHEYLQRNKIDILYQNELLKGISQKILVREINQQNQPVLTSRSYNTITQQNISINPLNSKFQQIHRPDTKTVASTDILIPHLLRKYYPNIDYITYKLFVKNEQFLKRIIMLCENCFLKYSSEQAPVIDKIQTMQDHTSDLNTQKHLRLRGNSQHILTAAKKEHYTQGFIDQLTQKSDKRLFTARPQRKSASILSQVSPIIIQSIINTPMYQQQMSATRRSQSSFKGIQSTQFVTNDNSVNQQSEYSGRLYNKLEIQNKSQLILYRSISNRI